MYCKQSKVLAQEHGSAATGKYATEKYAHADELIQAAELWIMSFPHVLPLCGL